MKTIIKIKTWRCPDCDYTQDFDPMDETLMAIHFPEGVNVGRCPACFLGNCPDRIKKETMMVKETNPNKKTTFTIIGEEDIETEIQEIKKRKQDKKENKDDPDLSTPDKENAHRVKRKQDIKDAIAKARLLEDK